MKFAIIKERKNPPDKRVVLPPQACKKAVEQFPEAEFVVESSDIRIYKDKEYEELGVSVVTDVQDCDVLLGVKEVPIEALIPNKKYFFFSHTIKKQPYNRKLLQAVLDKNIELYDHEVIKDSKGQRLVAFGRYAGIVGAYNGFRAWGLKFGSYNLPKAENLHNQQELIAELCNIKNEIPNIKILLTGKGRVGNGAKEMLDAMGIKKVSSRAFRSQSFSTPVYCQIDVMKYNKRKDGRKLGKKDFYQNPEAYKSNFMRFAKVTDFYIAGHFYGDKAPFLYTKMDVKHPSFSIKVVADVSCDIDGPVATTIRPSTIANPIYGYDPKTGDETDYTFEGAIAVMAVDNLPCELPRDASEGFAEMFLKHVIPAFFDNDKEGILERACMTRHGKLTPAFSYLQDYVDG
ncbi:NAD(P)-dependent oxidoreductase [Imtechella halotolerans]|uniref:NAD(P)-dependent oxidoreductase n=1 Tax=Imtechella halotolerans TaxID=1165090 RepID=UPI00058E5935|nr:NAD(P)-dependent oxidoreductase [Imtechella halotolerans]WMQ64748.1 NAD(P)-dependent oxidoreductase [Imtechella halotolerans]